MVCESCGKEIRDGTAFCRYCGKKLAEEPVVATVEKSEEIKPIETSFEPSKNESAVQAEAKKNDNITTPLITLIAFLVMLIIIVVGHRGGYRIFY